MEKNIKDKIEKCFDEYVSKYNMQDEDISYKYYHSYRVMHISMYLAEKLGLSQSDLMLAKLIGIYHDIGRFDQDKIFNNFEDQKTFDHGDYGSKIIVKENILTKLDVSKEDYGVIIKAIKNHNKLKIEDNLSDREMLFCKLIRDADKIDILVNCPEREKQFFVGNDDEVYDVVNDLFYNHQSIDCKLYDRSQSKNNNLVFYLAYVFDLNFKESFKYLCDHHILEHFYNSIEKKDIIEKYYEYAKKYAEEMK